MAERPDHDVVPGHEHPDDGHGDGHDHGHGHSHSAHSVGGWADWRRTRTLQIVLAAIAVAGIATAIGVIALWPSSEGRDAAVSAADEIGLVNDRLVATVTRVEQGPCSYSTSDFPQECRVVSFEPDDGPSAGETIALPEINLTNSGGAIPEFSTGDRIIVGYEESTDYWFYQDRDRRSTLVWLAVLFAVVVIAFARVRGVLAMLSMATTIAVLVIFVGPSVFDGNDRCSCRWWPQRRSRSSVCT